MIIKQIIVSLFVISMLSEFIIADDSDIAFLEKEYACKHSFKHSLKEKYRKLRANFVTPNPRLHTKFFLYTMRNSNQGQELILGDRTSVENSNFDSTKPIRILIHGYMNTRRSCFNVLIRNAYLYKGDFNVIIVDWHVMASRIIYSKTINWLDDVAEIINEFTRFLHQEFQVSFNNIYLIGHSLGAHVAGLAGRQLQTEKYDTIFALDPAGPSFQESNIENIVRAGDADYVESIQTDIKRFGFKGQIGNASFYPDFGRSQKICPKFYKLKFACNHDASYLYFAESIYRPDIFIARPCNQFENILEKNCVCTARSDCDMKFQMGGEPSTKKSGVFYFDVIVKNETETL